MSVNPFSAPSPLSPPRSSRSRSSRRHCNSFDDSDVDHISSPHSSGLIPRISQLWIPFLSFKYGDWKQFTSSNAIGLITSFLKNLGSLGSLGAVWVGWTGLAGHHLGRAWVVGKNLRLWSARCGVWFGGRMIWYLWITPQPRSPGDCYPCPTLVLVSTSLAVLDSSLEVGSLLVSSRFGLYHVNTIAVVFSNDPFLSP